MAIYIRSLIESDRSEWLRLRNALWPSDDHTEEIAAFFRGELDEPVAVLLAVNREGRTIAHVELSLRKDVQGIEGLRAGYIEGLYVEPGHRHIGIARMLLRASESWAQEQNCEAFASDRAGRIVVHQRFRPNIAFNPDGFAAG
jgi:aminoglycoside 6'-N-acetyltransferase I